MAGSSVSIRSRVDRPAALPATDHPLVNGVVLGRVHHALHPAVHHDGDGGGLQQHPLPPVVVDVLENVVAGPARPQGGRMVLLSPSSSG